MLHRADNKLLIKKNKKMGRLPKEPVIKVTELNEDREFEFRYQNDDEIVRRAYSSEVDKDGRHFHSAEFKSAIDRIAVAVYLRGYWGTAEGSKNFRNTFYASNGHKIVIKIINVSGE